MYVDYLEVGQRIAKRRRELGYKQWQVNEQAGLSEKYLSNIERGKSVISIDVLMKLCNVLETTPNYLLLGSIEKVSVEDYEKAITKKMNGLNKKEMKLALNFIDWLTLQNI